MFDEKNEPHEFIGETKQDAIAKACQYFGAEESDLEVGGFESGAVYGLGGRAVIVAARTDRVPGRSGSDRGRRDQGDRGNREDRDRNDSRARPNRGDRDREASGGRDREPRGGGDRERGRDRDRDHGDRQDGGASESREVPRNTEPSVGTPIGELGETGEFLLGVIERMNLGPFTIKETEESELLIFDVSGPAAGALSGGEGRAVDALQLLTNQRAMQAEESPLRVVVDMEGESEARETFLTGLAQRVAKRALDSGRAVALDPMNARDRRLIHVALRDDESIATKSAGEGRYRQVVVVPKGAPEFDDASRDS